ncbi:MAG: mucoidy inhibitor MuiA family protein, partial [Marinomonas sp.]
LPDLPQWTDPSSLRVSMQGAGIATTRMRTDALPPQPSADSPAVIAAQTRIDAAQLALRDLDDAVEDAMLAVNAADAQLNFLIGLASSKTLPSDTAALTEVAQMVQAQTLAATQAKVAATRTARRIGEGRMDLQQELTDARAALAALTPPSGAKALLALSATAPEAGLVTATVSYPVSASWQPTYDVMLSRGDTDQLTLRRAALITQNSGENWEGVTLTLSTVAPSGQVAPTTLYPQLLRFEDPKERAKLQRSVSSLSASMDGAPTAMVAAEAALPSPNFDGPGVTYTLPAAVTIAQNAEAARVELDALRFDASVFARAVPVRDTTAFLMAKAKNTSPEPLLAADAAQIFVDGALVGRSHFNAVPAGGDLTQAFGPIEDLRLTHVIVDRSEGDRGLISRSNAQTQDIRMNIENLGTQNWNVELLEALPYGEQDDLIIEWVAQPRADVIDVEDRRGLVQWNFDVAPHATQNVTVEQSIRWPDGTVLR